jgi:DNA-binding NarL/FixJ family response regulator
VLAPSATRRLIERFVPSVDSGVGTGPHRRAGRPTERERDVFVQIAAGRSNREIASALHTSPKAPFKVHVKPRAHQSLDCRDRVQAVILAYESAIVTRGGERL